MKNASVTGAKNEEHLELLFACIDGELSVGQKHLLDRQLSNPVFKQRWCSILEIHTSLRQLGEEIRREPIPERLLAVVHTAANQ